MNIAFHCNQLSIRGTEVAMYDYAKYNEELLGNKSIIITKHPDVWKYSDPLAIEKFKKRFEINFYKTIPELHEIIESKGSDIFYALKAGVVDDVVSKSCKTVVHSVFQYDEPHGNVYAYISEWLSNLYGKKHPFVPHMIDLPDHNENMREELGIPKDAIVFGRHGGYETFDIAYAKQAVIDIANTHSEIYFLFLNTEKFSDLTIKNIIYIDPIVDLNEKVKFINTCDAMIHARQRGESFGLAIGEFSIKNKPVITCANAYDKAHLEMLKNKGIYYSNYDQLVGIFNNFKSFRKREEDWNAYRNYVPELVMKKFKEVFID